MEPPRPKPPIRTSQSWREPHESDVIGSAMRLGSGAFLGSCFIAPLCYFHLFGVPASFYPRYGISTGALATTLIATVGSWLVFRRKRPLRFALGTGLVLGTMAGFLVLAQVFST